MLCLSVFELCSRWVPMKIYLPLSYQAAMRSILIFRRVTFEDNKSINLICTKSVRFLINSRNLKYPQLFTFLGGDLETKKKFQRQTNQLYLQIPKNRYILTSCSLLTGRKLFSHRICNKTPKIHFTRSPEILSIKRKQSSY